MTYVVWFVLHYAHQLLQTETTIVDHDRLWSLAILRRTVGHTCTFFSIGTSGTALLIIDMLLIKSLASAGNLFSKIFI
jgi:hypothetical protein